jgi:1-acyl-sn-glycerol-3-phosphate acyltransferase
MSLRIWNGVLLIAAILTILSWLAFAPSWRAVRRYTQKCTTCGHLPNTPTERARRFLRRLSRFLVWIQVGKIEIAGLENLLLPGPKIIAPNHPHSVDPFIFPLLIPELRCMTARGVMKFCGGLGALILGPCGAFCADLRRGRGVTALNAGVRVLASGQTLLIFPEGWAYLDGLTRPFKRGVVHIARRAAQHLGQPVAIIPVHLRHRAHPGAWINRLNPRLQFLLVALLFPVYRRGLKVVVGEAILSSELPKDEELATENLRDVILVLGSKSRR